MAGRTMDLKDKRLADSDPGENADRIEQAYGEVTRQHGFRLGLALLLVLVLPLGLAACRWRA